MSKKKEILGFTPGELKKSALLLVVHQDGSYDYLSTRTLTDVQKALEAILRDVKTEIEETGDF